MTRLELVREVVRLAGLYDSGPATTLAQSGSYLKAVKYVDIAYQEIQSMFADWDFLWATTTLTTEAGTATYAGEADLNLWDVNRIYYDGDRLPIAEWNDYSPSTSSNAPPLSAVIRPDNKLLLLPTPDAAYTISYDYFKIPDVMSADDDEPLIPAAYQYVIVGRALMLAGNFDAAEDVRLQGSEMYQQNLMLLKNNQLSRRKQTQGRFESIDVTVVPE